MPPTLEARTADRVIACVRKAIEELTAARPRTASTSLRYDGAIDGGALAGRERSLRAPRQPLWQRTRAPGIWDVNTSWRPLLCLDWAKHRTTPHAAATFLRAQAGE
jgi:hypothetical protein